MEKMTLIDRFANPDIIKTMSLGDKMLASLYVTLLGMAITFIALSILWGMIALMSRILGTKSTKIEKQALVVAAVTEPETTIEKKEGEIDEAIVAVIAAAVASSMNTSVHNIIVRNIRRTQNALPAWGNAGRFEQMKTRVQ
ncbi:MAG: OadG family protein [Peptostreptococcaceae bacterium]|nr:OadG family protein [Peptostreptococcaceae bacterium]